ncbi:sugar phosphate isomerase/epimerase [Cellulophaga sp. E16_2]|uniref:Xylose isomerase domain-containing protein TIM barrel n=1 Tax=Cellulophaga algicola (strain DSM 14237 / IC166 / ACAM 630) TaxID=688270 RepID=E6XDG3_CELAD|nr:MULTISPECIES: sugar phosphate isomerase/epimerase [Cellulophaga]ADV49095.1 Xylose isomerase domain-containing protein TIM barrel [Cellulophaga algicola DSM 14237]MBO0591540.1 sugar phosphate isomerase/epimerase [Cellulophaga sp. E16_2]
MKKITCYTVFLALALFCASCKEEKKAETPESAPEIIEETNFGGLALYTVRDDMGTDAKATLEAVSDAGYKNIEAAGYEEGKFYNMTPVAFKTLLDSLELTPISSHHSSVTLENAAEMMADVKAAGFEYFVVPIPPMGLFHYDDATSTMSMSGGIKNLTEIINALGEKAHNAGLKLLYHNHDFEFKKDADGIVPIDYLLEHTDPKFVNFQMDLFWVTKAGADPIAYFEKYPGRFKIWHVKDMDEQGRFAPVGTGTIDFAKILAQKDLSGMEYYMVEQDMTFDGMKPLEAIKISHEGIKEFGFE